MYGEQWCEICLISQVWGGVEGARGRDGQQLADRQRLRLQQFHRLLHRRTKRLLELRRAYLSI